MKIAIIAAMESEIRLLKELAFQDLIVAQTGIGKVNAALKTAEIIGLYQPDLIINSGVAGGLDKSLNIGDMVAGQTVCYHDVWCGAPNAQGQIQGLPPIFDADSKALAALDNTVVKGLILSGDQFIEDQSKLLALKANFPQALAVDMESAAVAQTCFLAHVPFLSLRLISDTPGVKHHQAQYDAFWQNAAENSFQTLKQVLVKLRSKVSN